MATILSCRVNKSHGTEGPKHDPYSYEEYSIIKETPERTIHAILHFGLSRWMKLDGVHYRLCEEDRALAEGDFKYLIGMTINAFRNMVDRRTGPKEKCPKCGTRKLLEGSGFAGEPFQYCSNGCGILWSADPRPYCE